MKILSILTLAGVFAGGSVYEARAGDAPLIVSGIEVAPCQTRNEADETGARAVAGQLKAAREKQDRAAILALAPDMEKAFSKAPKYPYAVELCNSVLTIYTDNVESGLIVQAAVVSALKNNIENTVQTVKLEPSSPYALLAFGLGWVYAEQKEYGACADVLSVGSEFDPWYQAILAEYMFCLAQSGRNEQSLLEADKALNDTSLALDDYVRAKILRHKGYALVELSQWEAAEKAYLESLKFDPKSQLAENEIQYIRQKKPK